jgi:hypothetical protein
MHSRAVCIEDASNLDLDAALSVIVEEQGFGATLSLIVAGPGTNTVHMAPIVLGLRVHRGIAINLACRSLQNSTFQPLGKAQHIYRAVYRRFRGLHRIVLVLDGRCWAGQVVDFVNFDIQGKSDVVAQKFKARVCMQMFNVVLGSREEIVHADNLMTIGEQSIG